MKEINYVQKLAKIAYYLFVIVGSIIGLFLILALIGYFFPARY